VHGAVVEAEGASRERPCWTKEGRCSAVEADDADGADGAGRRDGAEERCIGWQRLGLGSAGGELGGTGARWARWAPAAAAAPAGPAAVAEPARPRLAALERTASPHQGPMAAGSERDTHGAVRSCLEASRVHGHAGPLAWGGGQSVRPGRTQQFRKERANGRAPKGANFSTSDGVVLRQRPLPGCAWGRLDAPWASSVDCWIAGLRARSGASLGPRWPSQARPRDSLPPASASRTACTAAPNRHAAGQLPAQAVQRARDQQPAAASGQRGTTRPRRTLARRCTRRHAPSTQRCIAARCSARQTSAAPTPGSCTQRQRRTTEIVAISAPSPLARPRSRPLPPVLPPCFLQPRSLPSRSRSLSQTRRAPDVVGPRAQGHSQGHSPTLTPCSPVADPPIATPQRGRWRGWSVSADCA
jgi:hypothetical protein